MLDSNTSGAARSRNLAADVPPMPIRRTSYLREQVIPRAASAVPIRCLHAALGMRLIVPYWHMVSDEKVAHVKNLYTYRTIRQFTQDIDFFLKHYKPTTLQEVVNHLEGRSSLPRRCFLPTFDDGFREMHDIVAPILKAKGVSAVFFLCSGFIDNMDMAHHCKLSLLSEYLSSRSNGSAVGAVQAILERNGLKGGCTKAQMVSIRYSQKHLVSEMAAACGYDYGQYLCSHKPYLTGEQIRRLIDQGFSIGAHSIDHPLYRDLSLQEQLRQTGASIRFLVDHFGVNYRAFAFPHSDAEVGLEFFNTMKGEENLQVSFGTAGLRRHFCPWNIERFGMENQSLPTAQVAAASYLRGLRWKILG